MPAPPLRGNLHVHFDCVELRFVVFCELQCSCKFHSGGFYVTVYLKQDSVFDVQT